MADTNEFHYIPITKCFRLAGLCGPEARAQQPDLADQAGSTTLLGPRAPPLGRRPACVRSAEPLLSS